MLKKSYGDITRLKKPSFIVILKMFAIRSGFMRLDILIPTPNGVSLYYPIVLKIISFQKKASMLPF